MSHPRRPGIMNHTVVVMLNISHYDLINLTVFDWPNKLASKHPVKPEVKAELSSHLKQVHLQTADIHRDVGTR